MSGTGDHPDEMRAQTVLDDEEMAALLAGEQVDLRPELHELGRFVGEVRHTFAGPTLGPAPHVGPQLTAVFDRGVLPEPVVTVSSTPKGTGRARRLLARVAAATAGLTLVTAGAAAADLLPRPAQDGVAAVVERVTPLDLPDSHERPRHENPDGPAGDPQPLERPAGPGAGNGSSPAAGTSGPGAGQGGTVGEGQGGAGGAVPGGASGPAGNPTGNSPDGNGVPQPPATGANGQQAPAAQDHRRDPSLPPSSAPTANDNPGTAHRR